MAFKATLYCAYLELKSDLFAIHYKYPGLFYFLYCVPLYLFTKKGVREGEILRLRRNLRSIN
ncbi:hypothetical protein RchiOBHm_Chr5g0020811 [Rosa chinensis]|uniref:Uncharacterized protein n=1 Tax=Rosa chinensis TaxID=74649 RepID=A0A2P6Q7C2_ROSCH|nr:hypothetical protein RchiOBHm_Chr5g0020811 [Rosa chinensis]